MCVCKGGTSFLSTRQTVDTKQFLVTTRKRAADEYGQNQSFVGILRSMKRKHRNIVTNVLNSIN